MFNMRKFLRTNWADEDKLISFIKAYSEEPPKRATARKWFERESVPSDWFATLLVLLELEHGRPISLIAFKK
jgi:hypothetical protein